MYCFQNWQPSPGWVYTTCFPPWCEPVGVFSIHREWSRQKVFLLSLWQHVSVLLLELEALARLGVYDMFSDAVWASWCLLLTVGTELSKCFPAKFVTKHECIAIGSGSPRQHWVNLSKRGGNDRVSRGMAGLRCEPVGIFSLHWEQSLTCPFFWLRNVTNNCNRVTEYCNGLPWG